MNNKISSSFLLCQVAVRIRPLIDKKDDKCIRVLSKRSLLFSEGNKNKPKKYIYDHVFDETTTQVSLYQNKVVPF